MSSTITETNVLSPDLKIVKTECYDADVIEVIARDKRFSKSNLQKLSQYKKGRSHANEVEVVYHYARGLETLRMGRLYPHNNLGLQSFPHDIRNPLLDKHYWDCDMENAHYVFMINIANKYNLRNDAIKYYVENRNDCLARISDNRRIAKTAYLKTGYGGNVKLYSDFYADDGIEADGDLTQLKEVEAEIQPLVDVVWNDPAYKQIKKLRCIKGRDNPKFSLFALILQTEECRCLLLIDEYLKTKNRSMDIYIHDGGEVRKLPNETEFPSSLLRGAEQYVLQKTQHKIKLVVKKMEHNYSPPPSINEILIDDDYEACIKLKNVYGDRIIRTADTWYVNLPETKHWEQGDEFVKQLIIITNFRKATEFGSYAYGSNATGCNNIFKTLCSSHLLYPVNNNFINDINVATKDKLYFEDKFWDFKLNKWFDIDQVIPLIYIKRPAPTFENITQNEINDFEKQVLNMFSNNKDRSLYLRAMARALSGNIGDKKWFVLKGERNSGKGILQKMCTASFGEYVCVYDPPMMKTNNNNDASEFRWVLTTQAHLKRVAFTNEVKNIIGKTDLMMDGNAMKKVICSGGDVFQARNHHKGEVDVINNTTSFMSMNEIPQCKPADAMENMILFDMPFKFVDESEIEDDAVMYRLTDTKLKDKIVQNTRWAELFLYLIFKNYKDCAISANEMSELNQAECAVVNKSTNATNPIALFKKAFIVNEDGWVSTEDIRKVFAPAKLSDVKLASFLKDRGFFQKRGILVSIKDEFGNDLKDEQGKIKKKSPQGYSGISHREEVDEEE